MKKAARLEAAFCIVGIHVFVCKRKEFVLVFDDP